MWEIQNHWIKAYSWRWGKNSMEMGSKGPEEGAVMQP